MSFPEILYHYTNAQGLMGILTPKDNQNYYLGEVLIKSEMQKH